MFLHLWFYQCDLLWLWIGQMGIFGCTDPNGMFFRVMFSFHNYNVSGFISFFHFFLFFIFRICLDTAYCWKLKTYYWKHCNKIIFKRVNSTMRPSFKIKFLFFRTCGSREQCMGPREMKRKRAKRHFYRYPNSHLIFNFKSSDVQSYSFWHFLVFSNRNINGSNLSTTRCQIIPKITLKVVIDQV